MAYYFKSPDTLETLFKRLTNMAPDWKWALQPPLGFADILQPNTESIYGVGTLSGSQTMVSVSNLVHVPARLRDGGPLASPYFEVRFRRRIDPLAPSRTTRQFENEIAAERSLFESLVAIISAKIANKAEFEDWKSSLHDNEGNA